MPAGGGGGAFRASLPVTTPSTLGTCRAMPQQPETRWPIHVPSDPCHQGAQDQCVLVLNSCFSRQVPPDSFFDIDSASFCLFFTLHIILYPFQRHSPVVRQSCPLESAPPHIPSTPMSHIALSLRAVSLAGPQGGFGDTASQEPGGWVRVEMVGPISALTLPLLPPGIAAPTWPPYTTSASTWKATTTAPHRHRGKTP